MTTAIILKLLKPALGWLKENWLLLLIVLAISAAGIYVLSQEVRITHLEGQNKNLEAAIEIEKKTSAALASDLNNLSITYNSVQSAYDLLLDRFRQEQVRNDRLATALQESEVRASAYASELEDTVSEYETRISGLETCEEMAAEMDSALREIVQ